MTNTQDAGKGIVPSDLALVAQPDINKDYYNVTIKDLKINKTYAVQFQWVELDGKLGPWSPGFIFTTSNETAPAVPTSVTVPSTGSGSIPVTLSVFPTNAKRVDVIITGGVFGTATIAHSFSAAGTTTIAAPAGEYVVQLRSISPTGVTSTVGTTFTITISSADIVVLPSTTPSTPTVSSTLGAIQLAWNGKTSSGANQPSGFVAAKVYVVNTVAMDYGIDYFIKIKTTNGNAAQDSAAVLATGSPARIGQVGNGDIVEITADKIKTGTISSQIVTVGTTAGKHVKLSGTGDPLTIYGTGGVSDPLLSFGTNALSQSVLTIKGSGTFSGDISAANGEFKGDLGASGGNFTVRSGNMSALSGNIGGWQINSNALKSSTLAYPSIQLDPVGGNPKIELRGSPGASDTGNYIKMDTTTGLRIGSIGSPSFTVSMDGSLSATKANFQNTVGGNTIVLDNTSFRMAGANGTTTLDYNSNITLSSTGNIFNSSGSYISLLNADSSTELWPGGVRYFQGTIFGSSPVSFSQYIYNSQLFNYAQGLLGVTWASGFYHTGSSTYNNNQVSTRFGDEFRPLGITPFGEQTLGQRLFSGVATSNSAINTDINNRSYAANSQNGDFYFSTA